MAQGDQASGSSPEVEPTDPNDARKLHEAEALRKRREEEEAQKQARRVRSSTVEKEGRRELIQRNVNTAPVSIKDVVKPFLRQVGLTAKGAETQEKISRLWYNIVGAEISGKARPVSFSRGLLTVSVESPALRQELQNFYTESILQSLREADPQLTIRGIRFRLGSHSD